MLKLDQTHKLMKNILYHLLFLVFIVLITGFVIFGPSGQMDTTQALAVSGSLVLYTIALAFVGETKNQTAEELNQKNTATKAAYISATIVFSLGVIYQILVSNNLDWWLLGGLVVMNLTKLISLIYGSINSKNVV